MVPPGGVATYLQNMCVYLAGRGHDIQVISRLFTDTPEYEEYKGVHIHRVRALGPAVLYAPFFLWASRKKYVALSQQAPFDLVHSDLPLMASLALAWLKHAPVVETEHTTIRGLLNILYQSPLLRSNFNEILTRLLAPILILLERYCLFKADKIISVSRGLRQELIEQYPALSARIVIIPNGIQFEKFAFQNSERLQALRAQIGIAADERIVLYLGRLMEQKRAIDLVYALPAILEIYPNVRLVIVGRKSHNARRIEEAISGLKLEAHVIMIDHVPYEHIQDYYGMADVYCLPSSYEGFPFTILEAMASGVPVVTTQIPGVIEQVTAGETGRLHPVADVAALAAAILAVFQQPDETKQMVVHAQEMVRQKYTWDVIGLQTETLFEDLVRDIEHEAHP
jgi:glycosyltransferase involved in cell wall biosynthesis